MRFGVAALLLLVATVPIHAEEGACPTVGEVPIAVALVDARLELRLEDGRRLRLAGLDPAGSTPRDPDGGETARTALATLLKGRGLRARLLSDKPDRWGRLPAMVFATDEAQSGGVAVEALARGLGRYSPEAGAHPCRDAFLRAEATARAGGLGLWHDPYYGVLAADDREGFAERAATIVVAEGRLRRVDGGPYRTKLRFAAPGEIRQDLLVAIVLPKVVKRFGEAGVRFEALIGRTVRVRGLLDLRFGPQIEIAGPDALEVVDPRPGANP